MKQTTPYSHVRTLYSFHIEIMDTNSKDKFQPCKISRNPITHSDAALQDYYYESPAPNNILQQNQPPHTNQGLETYRVVAPQSLLCELNYQQLLNSQGGSQVLVKSSGSRQQQIQQAEQEDFSDLWNQKADSKPNNQPVQTQHKKVTFLEQPQIAKLQNQADRSSEDKNDESSCELSEGEMAEWLMRCEGETPQEIVAVKPEADMDKSGPTSDDQSSSWGSLTQIAAKALQGEEEPCGLMVECQNDIMKVEQPGNIFEEAEFYIMDDHSDYHKILSEQAGDPSKQMQYHKFGPWQIPLDHYEAYNKFQLTNDLINPTFLCQHINWGISEQKRTKEEQKAKHFMKTELIQYGEDILVYDLGRFAKSILREGSHMYFGVQSYGQFIDVKKASSSDVADLGKSNQIKSMTCDYMYFPHNAERLMETQYPDLKENPTQSIKKVDILLSINGEKIAEIERVAFLKSKDRREVFEVKSYDCFEGRAMEYLGIIESKIGKFSGQWFCETSVFIPRKKTFSKKINEKDWQRFKMHLRLSETGSIVAELGIVYAKSSVTNCILYSEERQSQVMVGTLEESPNLMSYIVRAAGISPLMTLATAISRKIFVNSN